jgi:hypothetical protein
MTELSFLDMNDVRAHYQRRSAVSKKLTRLLKSSNAKPFADLALGISDVDGNYSAAEHGLGPQILATRPATAVLELGKRLAVCDEPKQMVDTIYGAKIPNLKISVGSEIAMMVRPETFWVANTRSIWAHLLVKHSFNYARANEELRLYRDPERTSEMDYRLWKAIYLDMEKNLIRLGEIGAAEAIAQKVTKGRGRNIWLDAIANAIYEKRSTSG